jgi:hypothetical protein
MIGVMTTATTTSATKRAATKKAVTDEAATAAAADVAATEKAVKAAARAASAALAARRIQHVHVRWLTSERIPALGQAFALSIDRYQDLHRRPPTWAEAVAGVDPALLTPIQQVPDDWPHQPALWRRELRQHLMNELRRTAWISYTRTPRSLQPGPQGRGWLRTTTPSSTPAAGITTTT